MQDFQKILVVFKTHLDVGFTGFARDVTQTYFDSFIPNAIGTARALREKGGAARFIWTTGSWLIHECLERGDEKTKTALAMAIRAGDIRWHGLPFTTHTEMMDETLFRYGLSLSQTLDTRFARKTIAAKMTDVPGHTKAMIPLLRGAGIELLHLGVNESSTVPCVPALFRWQNGADEILVMYSQSYGDFAPLGKSGTALYFAHTGDNTGGQSPREVEKLFARLQKEHPGAQIVAADLNDAALALRGEWEDLPVINREIGDSWIHGVGSDPKRMAMYKAMLRFRDTLPQESEREILSRGLLMIPEHTWGMDEKTFLHDNKNYARKDFEKVRGKDNYRAMEQSWAEQRAYLTDAAAQLNPENAEAAQRVFRDLHRAPTDLAQAVPVQPYTILEVNGWQVKINRRGIIKFLQKDGVVYADEEHILGRVVYEQFSKADYDRFFGQYNVLPVHWAIEDFQKVGMERGVDRYREYKPNLTALWQKGNSLIAQLEFPQEGFERFGCPRRAELLMHFGDSSVTLDFAYWGKPANRMAEAMWLLMNPLAGNAHVQKLGQKIDPTDIVDNGGAKLCATDFGVHYDSCSVEARDSALVAFGVPSLLNFNNTPIAPEKGAWFNLFNNVWGTNFGMWHEGDMRYRFVLTTKA